MIISFYRAQMASLVYLTTGAPSKIGEELMLAGHQVHEALAVSEALCLCAQGPIDLIVIGPDVEDSDLVEAQSSSVRGTRVFLIAFEFAL